MKVKLLTFKDWLKKVYGLSHVELMTKPADFQQVVCNHYRDYVEAWTDEYETI